MSTQEGEVIRVGEVYTLSEFQRRTDMGGWAFRKAIKNGLKVARRHGKCFIRGEDWLAYCNTDSNPPAPASA